MAEIIGASNRERKLGEFITHRAYAKQKKQTHATNANRCTKKYHTDRNCVNAKVLVKVI